MEKKTAILIAQNHLQDENVNEPLGRNCIFVLDNAPIEYNEYWYFDYCYSQLEKKTDDTLPQGFGGAPGFVVEKASSGVEVVSWGWLGEIKLYEKDLKIVDEILEGDYKAQSFWSKIISLFSLDQEAYFNLKKEARSAKVKKVDVNAFLRNRLIYLLDKKYVEISRLKKRINKAL